ncbi:PA0069 family radical SAM protein [Nordella sp. HKS 07]|uniref:PA0069 family radical SAM protein n=1 Tax=Nordella sp. HKS 07 TaxID=2712222 RepID=UPI0013E0F750|nr:PA0069 family radical SAM protein [Nordella sp. HKS 07]QIG49200.1 PA0069 family radical SAM protein [Nordella sp. HKS 07]
MTTLIDRRQTSGLDLSALGAGRYATLPQHQRGRGAVVNMPGRYERHGTALFDDGWQTLEDLPPLKTTVYEETPKKIITTNDSPDISFRQSINPYRGCEHGCSYCYARPTHAYMGLSPGLDFESKLFAKTNAAALLRAELSNPHYEPLTIALGANTDPYQPIEREYRITRQILEVLSEFNHPVGIVTKSALVLRDLDILTDMARRNLVKVAVSVTTLDAKLARAMEPRAATPTRRLGAIEALSKAGVPTVVMTAPIIPGLNDSEIESLLKAGHAAGAREAGYVVLRLPLEVKDIFRAWLNEALPDRAAKVMSLIRQTRQGKENDSTFGRRFTGTGPYAWSIGRRFEIAAQRLGYNKERRQLSTDIFRRPPKPGEQLKLF